MADRGPFDRRVCEVADYLATSRPTAVNLALGPRPHAAGGRPRGRNCPRPSWPRELLEEAPPDRGAKIARCAAAIGRVGADLLADGTGVLTHCNAGSLATAGDGTALAVIYAAVRQGKRLHVFADETRPLLARGPADRRGS